MAAGMLSGQHRMHPDIGTLISEAYYGNALTNHTLDSSNRPLERVTHPFVVPQGISGKAIVWLDTPWSVAGKEAGEWGPLDRGVPRYINPSETYVLKRFLEDLHSGASADGGQELKLAVLSPYTQQVGYIQRQLRDVVLQPGLRFPDDPRRRTKSASTGAFTVDSFQGNQASVIVVSLVRNHRNEASKPGQGLGFLQNFQRINVLLSRAERLLVIVGSWDFFMYQTSLVELDQTERTIWHWKRVLTRLDEWFEAGRALRMPADLSAYQEPTVRAVLGGRRRGGIE
jgi:superfamily I DNA and/or RNA helicase